MRWEGGEGEKGGGGKVYIETKFKTTDKMIYVAGFSMEIMMMLLTKYYFISLIL